MKYLICSALLFSLCGCVSSQENWENWAKHNNCTATGKSKILLAGSVYKIPQRRIVYEFECGDNKVWSDLGNYAKYNEWLEI